MALKYNMTVPKRLAAAIFPLFLFLFSPLILPIGASEQKPPKPEDVVERSILFYGSRTALYGIQRNGTLRSLIKFYTSDGAREGKSVTKFIRKGKLSEDLSMIEIELLGSRYTIGYDGQETWAIQDGEVQKPSAEVIEQFRTANEHSYEALLRYKENGAKLEFAGTNKLGTLEMYLIDMISASGAKTRYEISSRTGRIIYSNYEEDTKNPPVKYRLYYKNFKPIQNTLVPYEVQVFQDGKLIEERTLIEAAFNVQLEDKDFKAENASKPPDAAVKP